GGGGRLAQAPALPARRERAPSLPGPERAMRRLSSSANAGAEDEWEEF
ncbi:MAG: hypothetical protein FD187_1013, partial [bacterium]